MKNIIKVFIIAILSILSVSSKAQVKLIEEKINANTYKLKIETPDIPYKIEENRIKFKHYVDESKSGTFILPESDIFLAIPPNTRPDIFVSVEKREFIKGLPEVNPKVELLNDSVLVYSEAEAKLDAINRNSFSVRGYLWIGMNYCVHIKLHNYLLDDKALGINQNKIYDISMTFPGNVVLLKGVREEILSPSVILNQSFAENYKKRPDLAVSETDDWIDYTKTYLKLGTARDGIYRLTPGLLNGYGVPVSLLDPRTFKIYLRGEEIPIYVEGELDGQFDESDFIEFVGMRNMGGNHREISGYGKPYNEYLDRYSDTTVYWLTWDGDPGIRVELSDGTTGTAVSDTLNYYYERLHDEKNYWFDFSTDNIVRRETPFWLENKTWMHISLLPGGNRLATFSLNNIYPDRPAYLFSKLQSYASDIANNAHLVALGLNNNTARWDSSYLNKYQKIVLSAEINSNLLQSGNNQVKLFAYPTAAVVNAVILDWFEIEYPRYLIPSGDSLGFYFPHLTSSSARAVKVSQVNAANFSTWKYGDKYKKYQLVNSSGNVVFADTIGSADKYLITPESKLRAPKVFYVKQFVNLRNPNNQGDYLLITHKKFIPKSTEYSQFIEQHYQKSTVVIDIDDIYDEFSYGFFNPESVRDLLKATVQYWQQPSPEFVFLVGAATYDYHHNKTQFLGIDPTYNYVPSFGASVSDNWFVTWDSTGAYIPQMNVGRLPVNSVDEYDRYYQRHVDYVNREFSVWNKTFMFFSGGDGDNQQQLDLLRGVNNEVVEQYVVPIPIGGNYNHFYKTIEPQTNFGPYPQEVVDEAIAEGAVFISYLGHSGTQIWDNSINHPSQLKNDYDLSPLVTDFGCSTGRFAEPDVVSFSQLFTLDPEGQAIAYIGNSSLGFLSTSTTAPIYFYGKMLGDSVVTFSEALTLAKLQIIQNFGGSGVYQLFALTNTLIGDPIVRLPIPNKPDFLIENNGIRLTDDNPLDNQDSLGISLNLFNYGRTSVDSVSVRIEDRHSDSLNVSVIKRIPYPLFSDTLIVQIPIKGKSGKHDLSVVIDPFDEIEEIYETNNSAGISYNVASSDIRQLLIAEVENSTDSVIVFLNPALQPVSDVIEVELSADQSFSSPSQVLLDLDTVYTNLSLAQLQTDNRYWIRSRVQGTSDFGPVQSFIFSGADGIEYSDSTGFDRTFLDRLNYSGGNVILDSLSLVFHVESAGANDGSYAIISKNGQNYVSFSQVKGHHVCIFNSADLEFIEYHWYKLNDGPAVVQAYMDLLDTLSTDWIIMIAVANEGTQGLSAELKTKIKTIGSAYIDSLSFGGSWAIIGYKGAPTGSVPEGFTDPLQGPTVLDTVYVRTNKTGYLSTDAIGPIGEWNYIELDYNTPGNSGLNVIPIGVRNGVYDTLNAIPVAGGIGSLESLNQQNYQYAKFLVEFNASSDILSPELNSIFIKYLSLPELSINYQVVKISADSVVQGEEIQLGFSIYNAGQTSADSFRVQVNLIKPDKNSRLLLDTLVARIDSMSYKNFTLNYLTNYSDGFGDMAFEITADTAGAVTELYKDNNFYRYSFYVKEDTVTSVNSATISVTFDGIDIFEGDFTSTNPDISMILDYQPEYPYDDTNYVKIYLDGKRIYSTMLDSVDYDTASRRVAYKFSPRLEDGQHIFRVDGQNLIGNIENSYGYEKLFVVSSEAKLLYVYNYPNPFASETYFTFKLTQIPDKVEIKIYTVAGRLVNELVRSGDELNLDFNRIFWDGRDKDGDLLANGTYLYKIIMRDADKTRTVTQKFAIVR